MSAKNSTTSDAGFLEKIRDPSYTPATRDLAVLLDSIKTASDDVRDAIVAAVIRTGPAASGVILERLPDSRRPLRGDLVKILGRIARVSRDGLQIRALMDLLADPDLKTRKNAVLALAHLPAPGVEDAFLKSWAREDRVEIRRSIAAAMGKVGSARSIEALTAAQSDDPELRRIVEQSILMLSRTGAREQPSEILSEVAPELPVPVIAFCRAGLERILASEFDRTWHSRVIGPGRVGILLHGPLKTLFQARTALVFGFTLPVGRAESDEAPAAAVGRALISDAAAQIFQRWTRGLVRYRIEWMNAGHRRGATWSCAKFVADRRPDWINDPTNSTWEAWVEETRAAPAGIRIALVPKKLPDPRFLYRVADVPAASHPTIAAALARVAGSRPDDVVWDPFVGSGTELIERARLGPCRQIHASDVNPKAVAAARRNFQAAGTPVDSVSVADALKHTVPNVTLILTNPPLGRRNQRGTAGTLLDKFLAHAATLLNTGGRLVWVSPTPERHGRIARQAKLKLTFNRDIDMGGFSGQIQKYEKI